MEVLIALAAAEFGVGVTPFPSKRYADSAFQVFGGFV